MFKPSSSAASFNAATISLCFFRLSILGLKLRSGASLTAESSITFWRYKSEIARDVSESLRSKLSGAEKQRFARNPTENVEAYNLYLQGRYHWNKFTGDGIKTAIKYYEQAIEKDKNYSRAYAGLASCYIVLGVNAHMPVAEARPLARAAVETAIVLDDQLAEAHVVLGANKLFFDWDFDGAEREFKTAMALDPGYAHPHQLYSYVLRSQSRFDEAIAEAKEGARSRSA
jgi:Tfp pilus assembly protein PilF